MKHSKKIFASLIGLVVAGALSTYLFYKNERSDTSSTAKNLLIANANISQVDIDKKILIYQQNQAKYQAKIDSLFSQATALNSKSWTALSAEESTPSFKVLLTADNHVIINDNLKDYFAFFLNNLTNTISLVESVSRFLNATESLPEPARTEVRALFKKYLLVELNLMDRIREGAPQTNALFQKLQAIPIENPVQRNTILHQMQLEAQKIQLNKEITMQALGGKDILSLYQESNQRANTEIKISLISTDNHLKPTAKITQMLDILGIKPQEAPDAHNGGARLAYSSIDANILSNAELTEAEKDKIRLEYFGSIYLEEYIKIYRK